MSKTSMYDIFETDQNLESDGVWFDYGSFRVKCAAAGQGNSEYVKYAEKKLKPIRRALDAGTVNDARARNIMIDIYSKTVIKEWEVKESDEENAAWKPGIHSKDGSILEVTRENVESALRALPRLFTDLQEQCGLMSNYQTEDLEEDSGNS